MAIKMCEECGIHPATIQVTQIMQDQTVVAHLCPQCAAKKGITISISSSTETQAGSSHSAERSRRCTGCGHSLADFRQSGRLGCPGCYSAFADEIHVMLMQVHGSATHKGKQYHRVSSFPSDMNALRRELSAAIGKEDFEWAAQLRDVIAQMKQEEDSHSHG